MTADNEAADSIRYTPPAVMTLEEVAVYLGFAEATIRRMLRDRELPAAKVAGQWRFLTAEVDRWLADLSKQQYEQDEAAFRRSRLEEIVRLIEADELTVGRAVNLLAAYSEGDPDALDLRNIRGWPASEDNLELGDEDGEVDQ